MADKPVIEVTDEMILEGTEELYGHPIMEPTTETMRVAVEAVYRRMREVETRNARGVSRTAHVSGLSQRQYYSIP